MGLPRFLFVFLTRFGNCGLIPRLRKAFLKSLESYPLSAASTLTRFRGLPGELVLTGVAVNERHYLLAFTTISSRV